MASSEGATDVSTEERFERTKVELLELIEKLANRLDFGDGHGAATTAINGRDPGAGSTSGHGDPYDELAELICQYEMLAAQLYSGDGHGAATTTLNRRDSGAGSTPRIIVTAPRDLNEPVAARGIVINPFTGRCYGPCTGLRRRIPEADRNRMIPEDMLRATNPALTAYVTKLRQDMDAEAELAKKKKRKLLRTTYTVIAIMGFTIAGLWSGGWPNANEGQFGM